MWTVLHPQHKHINAHLGQISRAASSEEGKGIGRRSTEEEKEEKRRRKRIEDKDMNKERLTKKVCNASHAQRCGA